MRLFLVVDQNECDAQPPKCFKFSHIKNIGAVMVVTYILSRPGLMRSINRTFPLTFIVRGDAYSVAGGKWTQLTISLANFERLAGSPAGLWVLSMANCDDKAMDTLGTLWKSNWQVGLSPSAFHSF